MGNWRIWVEGTGQHHNDQPEDADAVVVDVARFLLKKGHDVTKVRFSILNGEQESQAENLLPRVLEGIDVIEERSPTASVRLGEGSPEGGEAG